MARPIDHLIEHTKTGVKVPLKAIYIYPDGHGNVMFADGTNWPVADQYEMLELVAGELLRPMQKAANRVAAAKRTK